MNQNPYQAPSMLVSDPQGAVAAPNRTLFILAGVGSLLACAYWAGMTLLLGLSMAMGTGSAFNLFFPVILIVLYAVRGVQILKGDVRATRRILWLHVVGGIAAVAQMLTGNVIVIALNVIKVCIHLFGGTTAMLATRSANNPQG
jgi:hypothetical protein